MPLPTQDDLHVNGLLTQMSVAFIQDPGKYVASQVFPAVPVNKRSGLYATYNRGDFLRDEAELRAPGTEAATGGYRVTTNSSYNCDKYSFAKDVSVDEERNADDPFRPDEDAVRFLTQKRLLKEEVTWGSTFFTTGVWTGSSTATDLVAGTDFTVWTDPSGDIIGDIDTQIEAVEGATAMLPNTLVVNRVGWHALRNHPDIVDRIKHTSANTATREMVAQLIGVERILVAAAVQTTSQEGATDAISYIFGNHALLCYTPASASLMTPAAGYTFRWTGLEGSAGGATVKSIDMPLRESTRHEISFAYDQQVVSGVLGAFFQSVA